MIEAINLQVKLKLCTSFIVKEVIALDPLARRQWLYTYKGIIQYADSHGNELTQEQIIGADIYRDLIQQVENLIEEEDMKGKTTTPIKAAILITKLFTKNVCNKYEKIFPYLMNSKRLLFKYSIPNLISSWL